GPAAGDAGARDARGRRPVRRALRSAAHSERLCKVVTMRHSGTMSTLLRWSRSLGGSLRLSAAALRAWGPRQVLTAVVAGTASAVVIGLATAPTPHTLSSRDIPTVPRTYSVSIAASAPMGLLIAT